MISIVCVPGLEPPALAEKLALDGVTPIAGGFVTVTSAAAEADPDETDTVVVPIAIA